MKKYFLSLFVVLFFLGSGCSPSVEEKNTPDLSTETNTFLENKTEPTEKQNSPSIVLPLDQTLLGYPATYKRFGEYFQDRFSGYHAGEDFEISEAFDGQEISVRAIATGTVRYKNWVSGYGGVMVLSHEVEGETVNAIYGHIDLDSSPFGVGDSVTTGDFLAYLGAHESRETDGERQHLHFALYTGEDLKINGYEPKAANLQDWINPYDFFQKHGVAFETGWQNSGVVLNPKILGQTFKISFSLPQDWDIEYVPSLQALNLYTASGDKTARERSQIFIRFFDANKFLTLSTVDIFSTTDTVVGHNAYTAKRYDIQKKSGVADFKDQPGWRNDRHLVTDFRDKEGFTRYYVVAKNPTLKSEVYEEILNSMEIIVP